MMAARLNILIASALIFLGAFYPGYSPVYAQRAVASIDTTSIKIGEQILLKLDVTLPRTAKILWPDLRDTVFSPIEIVGKTRVDTIETSRQSYLQYRQSLKITSFDTGYHTIPPITIEYLVPGDRANLKAITDSLILHVRTVDVDTTLAIRDIKPVMAAPITLAELWPVFAVAAVVGLLAGFVWYYLWRRKMKKPLFTVFRKPELPPWQKALQALDTIAGRKLWQNGKIKEYHTEVTDVLRIYLENQLNVQAMEMISSDIIESLQQTKLPAPLISKVQQVLQLADLVKFAKEQPLPSENDQSLIFTREFINETKPEGNTESKADTPDLTPTATSI